MDKSHLLATTKLVPQTKMVLALLPHSIQV
ncbi:hypothetical protein D046_7366B, partial [Vibrio parahaemolyticus V-223/04]